MEVWLLSSLEPTVCCGAKALSFYLAPSCWLLYCLTYQFSSVAQSCLILCDPTDCSTLGLPVLHQLPDFIQTHVPRVGDAIQPSHPLSSPSPPAFNLSQHQGLFQWASSLHQVAKVYILFNKLVSTLSILDEYWQNYPEKKNGDSNIHIIKRQNLNKWCISILINYQLYFQVLLLINTASFNPVKECKISVLDIKTFVFQSWTKV